MRFQTGVVVSRNVFDAGGFFEARLNATATDFQPSFWLQSDSVEIDIVQVASNATGDGLRSSAAYHCFSYHSSALASDTESGNEIPYTNTNIGEYVTFGVDYNNDTLTFYRNGIKIRTATAACIAGGDVSVVFSHDTNPYLGGFNNESEWGSLPYNATAPEAAMNVEYFRYWKTVGEMPTTETTTSSSTAPTSTATTEEPTTATAFPGNFTCDQPWGSLWTWDCIEADRWNWGQPDWTTSAFTADWDTTVEDWSGEC